MSVSGKTYPGKEPVGLSKGSPNETMEGILQEQTPPPDSYSAFKPCQHLKSVLESKANETAYSTYRQAVYISQELSRNKIYISKKDGSVVPNNKLVDLKVNSLKCTECSLNNFNHNFICLQCPHVGCFDNKKHAHTHFKDQQHFFGIDSHNGLLYCFKCGDYINHPELERIRIETLRGQTPKSKYDYDTYSNYSNPSSQAISGLKGFINFGSTCFMSCILQTLIHNPAIKYHFFNNDFHYFNCKSAPIYNSGGNIDEMSSCITCGLDHIFKAVYTSNNTEGFGLTNLLTTAWYKKKSLAGFQEQDAHEFWQFVLNEIHSEYDTIMKDLHNPSNPKACNCITHTTFAGELESTITCSACSFDTKKVDPMMDVSLEVDQIRSQGKTPSIYDCLDRYTSKENLDVKYKCQSCGDSSNASKTLKIKRAPLVLSIQLKRFKHSQINVTSSKIETPITNPLFLNLTKYTSATTETTVDGDMVFELFAVVCHIGSVNTGHYVVIIKNSVGQWFKFDDNIISLVSQEEVENTSAYLLFYILHRL